MTEKEEAAKSMRGSARTFELVGWGMLLACALDSVLGIGILAGGLTVFVTAIAATLLIVGIIVRKQAQKTMNNK